jgi:uncharacterized protein RhaS with RHS repeats
MAQLVGRGRGGQIYYYLNDQLGTPQELITANGENAYRYVPDPLAWIDPLGLERCPIFADTNFLDAAVKGDSGALDIIREGKTYLTPNQLHEFLNVSDKN